MDHLKRRDFIRTIGIGAALLGAPGYLVASSARDMTKNKLPRWRGFNLLDFFSPVHYDKSRNGKNRSTEEDFKWMADWGFDFVRIPIAYPGYLKFNPTGDRNRRITADEVLDYNEEALDAIEELIGKAHKYNLHVSLNLHRAPGYCINAGFYEPYNLWVDEEAQQAFCSHWEMWAKRFQNVSAQKLSFDLVNEPNFRDDMNDQFSKSQPVPGDIYRKVAKKCLDVIHRHSPDRVVIADGNGGGNIAVPELADLDLAQSCRGYFPHYISHYRAPWVWKNPDDSPKVEWPGVIDGRPFNRDILEKFYQPWIDLVKQGVGVHCGECGCYRETPHEVFLAWLNDVFGILTENNIGWGLWNFRGDFGVLDSGRKDVAYEDWHGHLLDRQMLNLLQKY